MWCVALIIEDATVTQQNHKFQNIKISKTGVFVNQLKISCHFKIVSKYSKIFKRCAFFPKLL